MDFESIDIQYPLEERIGLPHLFVERRAVTAEYEKWLSRIPRKLSKSRAILARKKSGKTAFIQRMFNKLWSMNGPVVPLYIEVPDRSQWYPDFAVRYFTTFVSQYISFLERDLQPVRLPLSLKAIREYGERHQIQFLVDDVDNLRSSAQDGYHDNMWTIAVTAPHRYATVTGKFFLVIIDEFQNLSGYIYRDRDCATALDKTVPGSYHEWSESKVAPMLVTGSAVGWLVNVIDTYLEAGRLSKMWWSPYLSGEEGLEAVYRYTRAYEEPVTNESALLLARLTGADPFFISCVIRSQFPDKDLSTPQGVTATVQFELTDRRAELGMGWKIYFNNALDRINQQHAKKLLLHLTRHHQRSWTPAQLVEALDLGLDEKGVYERLTMLTKADLIEEYPHGYVFQGLEDGTFHLVIQNMYKAEMEAMGMEPEDISWRKRMLREKRSLQGALNEMAGRLAELQLANDMLVRKTFPPGVYFKGLEDEAPMEVKEIRQRFFAQSHRGGGELDLVVDGGDDRLLAVEVKKRKARIGVGEIRQFLSGVQSLKEAQANRRIIPAYLALGGFTEEALALCRENHVGVATRLEYVHKDWTF